MRKLVKLYRILEWVVFGCVMASVTFGILNACKVTNVNWWLIASPFIFMAVSPLIQLFIGFLMLLGKDFYGRYNYWRAIKLEKEIRKGIEKVERELSGQ